MFNIPGSSPISITERAANRIRTITGEGTHSALRIGI